MAADDADRLARVRMYQANWKWLEQVLVGNLDTSVWSPWGPQAPPPDAELLRVHIDPRTRTILVLMIHPSWDIVPEGAQLYVYTPTYTRRPHV